MSSINLMYNKRTLQAPPTKHHALAFHNILSRADCHLQIFTSIRISFQRPLDHAVGTTDLV
jgi:hypothetical protein